MNNLEPLSHGLSLYQANKLAPPTRETILAWSFEHSPNCQVITDLEREIVTVNKAFLDWFGFSMEELIGKNVAKILRARSLGPESIEEDLPKNLELNGEWRGEVVSLAKNDTEVQYDLTIKAIYSPEGEKIGYLSVGVDIGERKKLETQIMQGEKLSNIGEGIATLMHEVRNPLSGISMNVFMLEAAAENGKQWTSTELESLQLISKEVKRLGALVKRTLGYARNFQIYPQKIALKEFFDEMKSIVIHMAQEHSVEIKIKPGSDDLFAFFDPDSLRQVFLNLLQNAIEAASHSGERVVRMGARVANDPKWRTISASSKVLLLNVDNSGVRISEHDALNLFKPFFTSKAEGIGLGLATSSKLVRMHHGILGHYHIEEPPFSTRFTVVLPI